MIVIDVKEILRSKKTHNFIILLSSIVTIYLLISIYFINHTFFGTSINGVDISLKARDEIDDAIRSFVKDYELKLIERDGKSEVITGQNIGMEYSNKNISAKIFQMQAPLKWMSSLFIKPDYYTNRLFLYDESLLQSQINELNCLNKDIIEPQNVGFKYTDGAYELIKEIYGNKIIKENLNEAIEMSIARGITKLDLDENHCYEYPAFTMSSTKTSETKKLLDKYVSTKVTYFFRDKSELLDGNRINQWLSVDENLEIVIDEKAVQAYMKELSKKYDTVGVARKFKTSVSKVIEVKGGFYGWKIDRTAEAKALIENIKLGEAVEKEPIFAQTAFTKDAYDIGNTYVEINLTRQYLWFYKDGKLIAHGNIVTGNPNNGNATAVGIYVLNYKQSGSTLKGHNYEADVTYWMPFNGNIGIHDASWRSSFGGDIYKSDGTHGCVNAPLYLAKKIFDNIESGTPVVCYEEE